MSDEIKSLRTQLSDANKVIGNWITANSPGGWIDDLRKRAENYQRRYAILFDQTKGTPCEQIRHREEVEELKAQLAAETLRAEKAEAQAKEFRDSWNKGEWPVTFRDLTAEKIRKATYGELLHSLAKLKEECSTKTGLQYEIAIAFFEEYSQEIKRLMGMSPEYVIVSTEAITKAASALRCFAASITQAVELQNIANSLTENFYTKV